MKSFEAPKLLIRSSYIHVENLSYYNLNNIKKTDRCISINITQSYEHPDIVIVYLLHA